MGFLSLAAASPQNFPGPRASMVTSPLSVSLLGLQFSASDLKGETVVPPLTTTASSGQSEKTCHLTPLGCPLLGHAVL